MILKKGQKFECPECGEEWEDPIEDYTVPGRVGAASAGADTLCPGCDIAYSIVNNGDGTFDIESQEEV